MSPKEYSIQLRDACTAELSMLWVRQVIQHLQILFLFFIPPLLKSHENQMEKYIIY